jgi:hypothetical protein
MQLIPNEGISLPIKGKKEARLSLETQPTSCNEVANHNIIIILVDLTRSRQKAYCFKGRGKPLSMRSFEAAI